MEYNSDNKIGLRVEVLRNGGVYTTLEPDGAPEVRNVSSSALKMSMSGTFLPVEVEKLPKTAQRADVDTEIEEKVNGASYGFSLDSSSAMMKSNNAGVGNSAAVCRIAITAREKCIVTLSCVNMGESNFDYGVVYEVDYQCGTSNTVGANGILKSFAGMVSSEPVEVTTEVPAGAHYIYIKYRKDGSVDAEGDYFAFNIKSIKPAESANQEIRWMTDRIRPILIVNGTEFPCGVFVVTTQDRKNVDGHEILSMEAYSVLYLANRVKIEGAYTIPAGTNYIAAVQELLQYAGITNYEAEQTDLVLSTDRADWPSDTPVLTVINKLLSEINYRSAWVDLSGKVRITKYTAPSADNIQHTYARGKYSIVSADAAASTDYFDKANVFRAVCSSPDLDEPLVATAENSDPNSPYSTTSLGIRILQEEYVDAVPDLATLQERAENMLTKSLQTTETVEFTTAINPVHESWDTVALDLGDITGIYTETEWSMVLDASGEMRHVAERVVYK